MKWNWVLIITLIAALIPGCGSSNSDIASAESEDESQTLSVDGPAADAEAPEVSEVDGFKAPFPDNSSFFAPPIIAKEVSIPGRQAQDNLEHAQVRVIGFSQLVDGEVHALVSVGGNLHTVRTGDTVNGVTVISLDAPSVTLQQRNDRWTIALFNQPIVNDQVTLAGRNQSVSNQRLLPPGNDRLSGNKASALGDLSGFGTTAETIDSTGARTRRLEANLPPLPAQFSEVELPRPIELPEGMELPEPPVLPGEPASTDQTPPGVEDLPRLPG